MMNPPPIPKNPEKAPDHEAGENELGEVLAH
jgi:hypothetical protein